ncbi:MAG: peptidase [Rhodanobacter denitrificans]|uniref:Peptidase n=1 Tax=Rhodanobacter denitrificans TaxID=666685 RepID=A0A2W5K9N2_9GAMM|nr:MAG: peptidase [Rhodanobacter denitrificans]
MCTIVASLRNRRQIVSGARAVRRLVVWAALIAAPACAAAPPMPAEAYARAERVLDYHLRGQVLNASIAPHWLPDGRFWYRRDDDPALPYVLIDPERRRRTALVDPVRLAAAGRRALGGTSMPAVPELIEVRIVEADGLVARFRGDAGRDLVCELPAHACRAIAAQPLVPPLLAAPDGRRGLYVRGSDLWLHDPDAGDRRLTTDGESSFGYGVLPDFALRGIPRRAGRIALPPVATHWSPDGRSVFGVRYDERRVEPYPYLATAPEGRFRPIVHTVRLGLLGDAEQVRDAWYGLDVETATVRPIAVPDGWNTLTEAGLLGWSADASRVYTAIVRYDRPARLRLVEIDLRDGGVRTIREEASDTRVQLNSYTYARPAVSILRSSGQAVWWSDRDGWGHLELIGLADGRVVRSLTSGDWLVRDLVGVDEVTRQVFFTANGREPGDPYQRRLYRVSLDGGEPVLLTPEAADHAIDAGTGLLGGWRASQLLSPSADYVVDSHSTVSSAPVTVLRSTRDGRVIIELERADPDAVYAAGWRAPRRERVKAADGRTDLYATLYLPRDYASDGRHPVIDAIYAGPHITNAPVGFVEATAALNPVSKSSLAELGFAVVVIDARGTPGRSKAFHDVSFSTAADVQLDDHVAAIGQLAQRYPGLDLDRVGVYGHSFGGYAAARALLRHPAFYKVGVASAGSHSFQGMYGGAIHGMDRLVGGRPVYAGGSARRPAPDAVPPLFAPLDNAALVERLSGKLMLVYGDLDENAMPALTLQLAAALTRANKDYDLLYLPNQDHELFRNDPYYTRRLWDYFVEHLMGRSPPPYRITSPGRG